MGYTTTFLLYVLFMVTICVLVVVMLEAAILLMFVAAVWSAYALGHGNPLAPSPTHVRTSIGARTCVLSGPGGENSCEESLQHHIPQRG